jgi:O-antigen ligase
MLTAVAAWTQLGSGYLHAVWASRGNLDSSGRTRGALAAFRLVAERPVVGMGPGQARLFWTTPGGNGAVALYAHDEYLQTLVDLGAIGLVLLLAVLAAVALTIRRGRRYPHSPALRAGAIAALAALAVHSGFDFLWHIAVLPLVGALLVGMAGPATREGPVSPVGKEKA